MNITTLTAVSDITINTDCGVGHHNTDCGIGYHNTDCGVGHHSTDCVADITTLTADIATLTAVSDFISLTADITTLTADITTLTADIATLTADITALHHNTDCVKKRGVELKRTSSISTLKAASGKCLRDGAHNIRVIIWIFLRS